MWISNISSPLEVKSTNTLSNMFGGVMISLTVEKKYSFLIIALLIVVERYSYELVMINVEGNQIFNCVILANHMRFDFIIRWQISDGADLNYIIHFSTCRLTERPAATYLRLLCNWLTHSRERVKCFLVIKEAQGTCVLIKCIPTVG
jgi:hypothetical protein